MSTQVSNFFNHSRPWIQFKSEILIWNVCCDFSTVFSSNKNMVSCIVNSSGSVFCNNQMWRHVNVSGLLLKHATEEQAFIFMCLIWSWTPASSTQCVMLLLSPRWRHLDSSVGQEWSRCIRNHCHWFTGRHGQSLEMASDVILIPFFLLFIPMLHTVTSIDKHMS